MSEQTYNKAVNKVTDDPIADKVAKLRDIFPEVFTEGKVDPEKLLTSLGDNIDHAAERFTFSWAGKRDARRILQVPSTGTLIPVPEQSVKWDTTSNVFIEGENLEVLKLLYRSYAGRIKMIYIDPPYNTGRDFIYSDDYSASLSNYMRLTGQKDEQGNVLTTNTDTNGRYHSAWLSMMYPRLFVARQLLQEEGVIFISIDDNEVDNLRLLMDEVFGEENFITTIIWQKNFSPKNSARHFSEDHDYILVYARNAAIWRPQLMPRSEEANARYGNPDNDPRGDWVAGDLCARNYYSKGTYEVVSPSGNAYRNPVGTYWRVSYEKFLALKEDNRIWWGPTGASRPTLKRFLSEVKQGMVPQTLWFYEDVGHTAEAKRELLAHVQFEHSENVLDTLKPTRLIQRMLHLGTEPNTQDIVLDFFGGSASTGHAVLKKNAEDGGNRRFIVVQFPERLPLPEPHLNSIADIGKKRLHSVISKMIEGKDGNQPGLDLAQEAGFKVYKLASSNFQSWTGVEAQDREEYIKIMELFNDPLAPGWLTENVISEVALKETGFGLNFQIQRVASVTEQVVYRVTDPDTDRSFYICLDEQLSFQLLRPLALGEDDLLICRDSALDDDTAANLSLQCRLKTI